MDWLAGSRQHILELIITRTLVLAPIFVLGFSKEVIDAYIVIVGFQAVFNHANVSVRLGPLRYVIVTPNFHHWHHSADAEGIDRNYAAHFAFLDYAFGTAHKADRPGRTATAWSATTCRTASSSSSPFRSSGKAEGERRACVRFDVAIVGAGAAGLHCAAIAGQLGCSVVLLDHAEKLAEKIRISGGGRCNFTNLDVGASNFDSENRDFCRSALARYTPRDFIDLVERHGIAWHEKHKGQLFCDGSSAQIIAMLRRRVRRRRRAALAAVPGRVGPRRRGRVRARHGARPGRGGATRRRHRRPLDPEDRRQRLGLRPRPPARPPDRRAAAGAGSLRVRRTRLGSRSPRWPASRCRFAIDAGRGARRAEFVDDLLFTHRGLSGPAALQASTYWRPGEAIADRSRPRRRPRRAPWPRRRRPGAGSAPSSPTCCRGASPRPGWRRCRGGDRPVGRHVATATSPPSPPACNAGRRRRPAPRATARPRSPPAASTPATSIRAAAKAASSRGCISSARSST